MKTQAEVQHAIELLTLLLTEQVKLDAPMTPEVQKQTLNVCRTLMWVSEVPCPLNLTKLLRDIEAARKGPSFNPHQSLIE